MVREGTHVGNIHPIILSTVNFRTPSSLQTSELISPGARTSCAPRMALDLAAGNEMQPITALILIQCPIGDFHRHFRLLFIGDTCTYIGDGYRYTVLEIFLLHMLGNSYYQVFLEILCIHTYIHSN